MRIKLTSIKGIVALALTAIIALQILWLHSIYSTYKESVNYRIADNLKQSVNEEFIHREKQLGGPIVATYNSLEDDTVAIRNFKVETADTTHTIPYDKTKRYNESKIKQSAFKYVLPLNIYDLDSIFNQSLIEASIPVKYWAIEIHDKEKNEINQTRKLASSLWIQNYETEIIWIDLADSMGIKAYVQIPYTSILEQLLIQLILSAILITYVTVYLFRLSQTIFRQYREERVKKDFVNVMTHELRRPITSALFMLDFLQDHAEANKPLTNKDLLDDSILALKKLNLYVEKIQEISHGEDGNMSLTKENIPLLPFFIKLKEKYESSGNSDNKKVSIGLQIDENINLMSDKVHFSNIMDNLMENSIKYSGENVNINIKVFQKNKFVYIQHRDNGWGISSAEIHNIFDKFYRGRSMEKRRKNGFGLGLSYVKTMMEQFGGSISVESKEKIFTEFTLIHPI